MSESKITKMEYHSYIPYKSSFGNNDEIRITVQQTNVYPGTDLLLSLYHLFLALGRGSLPRASPSLVDPL